MREEIKTKSAAETEAAGEALARALLAEGRRQAFLSLDGEMGVGKTAFARGFARALGCHAVRSPTYTVVNEYRASPVPIFHFDLYRVEDEDALYGIGFPDYLTREGYCLCEWSERGGELLPPDRITVRILRCAEGEDLRLIQIEEGAS